MAAPRSYLCPRTVAGSQFSRLVHQPLCRPLHHVFKGAQMLDHTAPVLVPRVRVRPAPKQCRNHVLWERGLLWTRYDEVR